MSGARRVSHAKPHRSLATTSMMKNALIGFSSTGEVHHRLSRTSIVHSRPQSNSTAPRRFLSTGIDPKLKRNVAIIAHVDHGKTSLVDCLLTQSGTMNNVDSNELLMDSNPLERERGITILSKSTAIRYAHKDGELYHINIVDTPGHADFGGEVERVMSMVDGVVLVVDATDGPMTQTKFVLSKALKQGLKPLVVINKVDRPTARVDEVESEIFDLFCMLDPTDEQLDYKVLYASAKEGFASTSLDKETTDMTDLFESLVKSVPPPQVDTESPFSMLVTQIEGNTFLGKCLIGRIRTGRVQVGDTLQALDENGNLIDSGIRVQKLFGRLGMEQTVLNEAESGDIISIAGFKNATVNSTLCDEAVQEAIDCNPIDPPTLSMTFSVNNSPLSGDEGDKVSGAHILARLQKEVESNVSMRLKVQGGSEEFEVQGRGELQLGILLEEMRREGFEVAVSPPKVVFKKQDGTVFDQSSMTHIPRSTLKDLLEPMEEVQIEVDEDMSGNIIEKLSKRKGELQNFETGMLSCSWFSCNVISPLLLWWCVACWDPAPAVVCRPVHLVVF